MPAAPDPRRCSTCQRSFDAEARFCPYDGTALAEAPPPTGPRRCPRCHREYDAEARFCAHDGEPLTELRQVGSVSVEPTTQRYAVLGGRYLIRGFIGKGATARVYLADDLEHGRLAAVKILDPAFARNQGSRERFLREASAAAKIHHPNVVSVFDSGEREEDRMPYLVMEFVFGESLGTLLRREVVLSPERALPILRQAASGLAAAHRAGVVHRDVKPDNIFLVGEPGSACTAKVLDFGMARIGSQAQVTAAGVSVGTVEYMAPEQVLAEACDGRTDVYALGLVMYRTFAGRIPFDDDENAKLLARQLIETPLPPSSVRADVDGPTEAVILRALAKRPDNRYPSMEALGEDLERLERKQPGKLWARTALPESSDRYEPRTALGKDAEWFFYRRLKLSPPPR